MSDNDLIRRGDAYDEISAALTKLDAVYNSGEITYEAYDVMWDTIEGLIDQVDTVPQEMSGRELLLIEARMLPEDEDAFAEYSHFIWSMKIDEAVAFAQNWAREHPERSEHESNA